MSNIRAIEAKYMNRVQIKALMLNTNILIAEIARATGKTEGIMAPRILMVAQDMPGELSFLVHKTYVALMTNVVPNIIAALSKVGPDGEPRWKEGVHFVIGAKNLPKHFKKPYKTPGNPKHCIVFCTGHQLQLVASDMPDSSAGASAVHAFVEEMKLQKGEKLKSRIFPAMRGSLGATRRSHLYLGITGVSDTARIDLGEDSWYEEFERNANDEILNAIANASLHHDKNLKQVFELGNALRTERNQFSIMKMQEKLSKAERIVGQWKPILNELRRSSTCYLKASSFVNKDFLGEKFFQTQYESLSEDEFLSSICNVRIRKVVDMFFANFNAERHCYSDSYRYNTIMSFDLSDHFKVTATYLKYFRRSEPLILGYDPGGFSSLVVAQEDLYMNEFRVQKEFFVYRPYDQVQLAERFAAFYGSDYDKSVEILLYYDRAGNKKKTDQEQISTDARILKRELEHYGFNVRLMNEGQKTIYHYEQYMIASMLFGEHYKGLPTPLIDENECPNLKSAIYLSPLKKTVDNRIELDKSSEVKVPLQYQAGLTTQLPSALLYLLYGHFADKLPKELANLPEISLNIVM